MGVEGGAGAPGDTHGGVWQAPLAGSGQGPPLPAEWGIPRADTTGGVVMTQEVLADPRVLTPGPRGESEGMRRRGLREVVEVWR